MPALNKHSHPNRSRPDLSRLHAAGSLHAPIPRRAAQSERPTLLGILIVTLLTLLAALTALLALL